MGLGQTVACTLLAVKTGLEFIVVQHRTSPTLVLTGSD
jgi:hypothetical protein